MTGGNDGLNTVVPYADDLYHAARPDAPPHRRSRWSASTTTSA